MEVDTHDSWVSSIGSSGSSDASSFQHFHYVFLCTQEVSVMHLKKFCEGKLGSIRTVSASDSLCDALFLHSSGCSRYTAPRPQNQKGPFTYDFSQLQKVTERGQRRQKEEKSVPMAWPEYLTWFTTEAPSYQRYLV